MRDIKPKIYPAEFKESAIKLAIKSNQPFGKTARELGITKYSLYNWVNKYSNPKKVMRDDEHLYDELKRLKKELDKVTQERDLLKKAAAYFTKEDTVKLSKIVCKRAIFLDFRQQEVFE